MWSNIRLCMSEVQKHLETHISGLHSVKHKKLYIYKKNNLDSVGDDRHEKKKYKK